MKFKIESSKVAPMKPKEKRIPVTETSTDEIVRIFSKLPLLSKKRANQAKKTIYIASCLEMFLMISSMVFLGVSMNNDNSHLKNLPNPTNHKCQQEHLHGGIGLLLLINWLTVIGAYQAVRNIDKGVYLSVQNAAGFWFLNVFAAILSCSLQLVLVVGCLSNQYKIVGCYIFGVEILIQFAILTWNWIVSEKTLGAFMKEAMETLSLEDTRIIEETIKRNFRSVGLY